MSSPFELQINPLRTQFFSVAKSQYDYNDQYEEYDLFFYYCVFHNVSVPFLKS
jgi:hypothetical protein